MTGVVVWFTGLPASGKTTCAMRVAERLRAAGVATCTLDSDEIRAALVPAPGYGEQQRADFYRTLGNLAALLARQGSVVLVPATANLRLFREQARAQAPDFIEVFVATDAATCADRDFKGLYRAAQDGDIGGLPGAGADYEPPESPHVIARGGRDAEAVERVLALLGERGFTA